MIPKKFKCAGNEIQVITKNSSPDYYGEFVSSEDAIFLYDNIGDTPVKDRKKQNTFYHELIHAWQHQAGMELDEVQAQVFANFFQEFMETYE